jgi:hypothetical protein
MTRNDEPPRDPREPATYEIRLQGHLDTRWVEQLGVESLTHEGDGTTILRRIATDQAALHGLLQRVRDLGLLLISVTRVRPTNQQQPSSPPSKENQNDH